MRSWMIGMVAVLVVGVLVTLGPILLPKGQYRQLVVDRLKASLPYYDVEVGDIRLRVLPSPAFLIKNLRILSKDATAGEPLLSIERLRGDVSWWDLISRDISAAVDVSKVRLSITCAAGSCNTDPFFMGGVKVPSGEGMPPPTEGIPVLPAPDVKPGAGLLIGVAHAATGLAGFRVKSISLKGGEVHYVQDGIERVVILNLAASVDTIAGGYSFKASAGKTVESGMLVSGACFLDRISGNLTVREVRGSWLGIPFSASADYCSSCSPKLSSWDFVVESITPAQLNSFLGQFDLELPSDIEWGGRMVVSLSQRAGAGIKIEADLSNASMFWKDILRKPERLPVKVSMSLSGVDINGVINIAQSEFKLSGIVEGKFATLKVVGDNFDLLTVKSYLPILSDVTKLEGSRIESIIYGETDSFPDSWYFSGKMEASSLSASGLELNDAKMSFALEDGLVLKTIEASCWKGSFVGNGVLVPGTTVLKDIDFVVTAADIGSIPVVGELLAGQADISMSIREIGEKTVKGSFASAAPQMREGLRSVSAQVDAAFKAAGGKEGLLGILSGEVRNVRASFAEAGGEITLDRFAFNIGKATVSGSGAIDPSGQELLIRANLEVPGGPELVGDQLYYLLGKDGVSLPLKAEGQFSAIKWSLDVDEMARMKEVAPKPEEKKAVAVASKPIQKRTKVEAPKQEKASQIAVPKAPEPRIAKRQAPPPLPRPQSDSENSGTALDNDSFFKIIIGK